MRMSLVHAIAPFVFALVEASAGCSAADDPSSLTSDEEAARKCRYSCPDASSLADGGTAYPEASTDSADAAALDSAAADSVTSDSAVADTTAPVVSITSPAPGTTFTAAQTVSLIASATDDVGVTKVEFYDNCSNETTATASALTSAGLNDAFVTKLEGAGGNHVWSKRFGGTSSDFAYGIAADGNNDAVVTGYFMGQASFGATTLTAGGASEDVFLGKLLAGDGTISWVSGFGSTSNDLAYGVAVNSSNEIVMTGSFGGTVSFGGSSLTSGVASDVFVAKYSASGQHVWSSRFGGTGGDTGYAVAIDPNGGTWP